MIAEFYFARSIGFYVNQFYVPVMFIVIISWIPFWLDRKEMLARVGLGVTTVLTMTTLVTQASAQMPKISYMKSLDIYLEFCFAMVFAALIQYAIIGYLLHWTSNVWPEDETRETLAMNRRDDHFISRAMFRIDYHSRWLFPLCYVTFNVWYWVSYYLIDEQKLISKGFAHFAI